MKIIRCPKCGSVYLKLVMDVTLDFNFDENNQGFIDTNIRELSNKFYYNAFSYDSSYYELQKKPTLCCRACGRKLYPLLQNISFNDGGLIFDRNGYKLEGAYLTIEERDRAREKRNLLLSMED